MNLLAVVDPFPGVNQVHAAPGVTPAPGWRHDRPVCSVCLGDHRRHTFYAIDGQPGLVGEPCLPAVVQDVGCVTVTGQNLRDQAASPASAKQFDLVIVSAAAHYAVRGWERHLSAEWIRSNWPHTERLVDPKDEAAAVAAVLEWLATIPEEAATDYENALVLLSKTVHVFEDQFNLAASAHQAYLRAERQRRDQEAERLAREASIVGIFVGTPGENADLPGLVCDLVKSLGTSEEHPEWGERFLIRFVGPQGEHLVWFTGEGGKFDPKPGESYNVRAGVKAHDVYDGVRQTVLVRCREYDPVAEAAKAVKPKRVRKKKGE